MKKDDFRRIVETALENNFFNADTFNKREGQSELDGEILVLNTWYTSFDICHSIESFIEDLRLELCDEN